MGAGRGGGQGSGETGLIPAGAVNPSGTLDRMLTAGADV
jgi:hypothetical protein